MNIFVIFDQYNKRAKTLDTVDIRSYALTVVNHREPSVPLKKKIIIKNSFLMIVCVVGGKSS